jgi:hypothetical protein
MTKQELQSLVAISGIDSHWAKMIGDVLAGESLPADEDPTGQS